MLKKSFAVVLLILALSPFNAPFQTGGGAERQHIAQIELLSAIRQNIDSRAGIEQRCAEPHGMRAMSLGESTIVDLSNDLARGALVRPQWGFLTGDYLPLA